MQCIVDLAGLANSKSSKDTEDISADLHVGSARKPNSYSLALISAQPGVVRGFRLRTY